MSDEVHAPFSFTTTVHINYLTLLGIMSSHSGDEDSQAEEDHPKRKSRFIESLHQGKHKMVIAPNYLKLVQITNNYQQLHLLLNYLNWDFLGRLVR